MLKAELRVLTGKQAGHVIPLVKRRFLIGREEDCHLRPNSDLVSRHHCVFKVDEYSLRLRDLGSTNGTLVNGERLRGEVMLNSGDRVSVGKIEFEVAIGDAVSSPVSAAVAAGASDPTDAFDLSETPSQSATSELSAANLLSSDDTTYQPPAAEQPTQVQEQPPHVQETAAMQGGDTIPGGTTPLPGPPPGYGQQPIGYSMPFPQQQYPYGQPYGMPMMGYPHQPMPFPQMGMYPQQQMPMPPQMPPGQPPPPEPAPPAASEQYPDVRLPDPKQTGAQAPEPKPDSNGEQQNEAAVMRDTAAEIIKQYTQRRPQA